MVSRGPGHAFGVRALLCGQQSICEPWKVSPLHTLEDSFFKLKPLEVRQAYAQSYFLMRAIMKAEGPDSIRRIIEGIQTNQPASTKHLMTPLDTSFDEIYRSASKAWLTGKTL